MLRVGVTGGIGSGKSVVCKVFSTLGIPVFDADSEAKALLNTSDVINFYYSEFGNSVFTDNKLDHKKIAQKIFSDKQVIEKINRFTHPLVFKRFDDWCELHSNAPYVIKEAALLFESGGHKTLDYSILVCASTEIRINRVMKRNNITRDQVLQRMAFQWTDDAKINLANIIIDNNGNEPILTKILDTHNFLLNQ